MGSPEPPRLTPEQQARQNDPAYAEHGNPPYAAVSPDGTQWTADEWLAALDAVVQQRDEALERVNQLEKALREIKAMGFGEGGGSASGYECAKFAERALSAAGEDAE